ncbi:HAD-IA family hydrolase [Pseudoalteromonas tetraodonis]|uniref:HAD family hydrolase n=1 Tax=Pseudoalteromonas tetraodonis TaxID=43659 RepID=UPI001BDF2D7E|nr:HAD-IA family hydrolase [Pseudoalteromonas tetraodonis]MBT2152927.1 HAD-IA family hydrolase [Pseudoalteromonas tetraodonis]
MKLNINEYATLVFDCDGVVLNSNHIKTNAFHQVAIEFGEHVAKEFVEYHTSNGGVSRYKKFQYLYDVILPKYNVDLEQVELAELIEKYAEIVKSELVKSEVSPGLKKLREKCSNAKWLIVSGGDQEELRYVFKEKGIEGYFDGGIFGSPDKKEDILIRELEIENISMPALFLGDSKYDYQASKFAGLDFLFLSGWSEVEGWQKFCAKNAIVSCDSISEV